MCVCVCVCVFGRQTLVLVQDREEKSCQQLCLPEALVEARRGRHPTIPNPQRPKHFKQLCLSWSWAHGLGLGTRDTLTPADFVYCCMGRQVPSPAVLDGFPAKIVCV